MSKKKKKTMAGTRVAGLLVWNGKIREHLSGGRGFVLKSIS